MAQKRNKNKKWIYWVLILVLLVAAGAVAYLVWDNYFRDKGENTEKVEISERAEDEQVVTEEISDEIRAKIELLDEKEGPDVVNYEPTISGVITYQAVENDKFSLRIAIKQPIDSDGACRLSITLGATEKYNNLVLMRANSDYYSCAFDVPLSGFSEGKYDFEVSLQAESQSGSLRGEFVYE